MSAHICASTALAFSAVVAFIGAAKGSPLVGYQDITVPTGYSLFTVTFKGIGATDYAYDIQDIVPYQNGEVVSVNAKVNLQKMGTTGAYLQAYGWRQGKGGWCKGLTFQDRGTVTLTSGEAVCVNNSTGADVQLRVSGAVELNPWSAVIPTGYSLIGNMTPSVIDIQDIVPYDETGTTIIAENAKVNIQKMSTSGAYLQAYGWRQGKGGWCKGLTYQPVGTITFEPGESACVNNSTGAPILLKFKSPVTE